MVLGTQQYSPKLELLRTLALQHAAYQVMLHFTVPQSQLECIMKTQDLPPRCSACCCFSRGWLISGTLPLQYLNMSMPFLQESCCFVVVGDRAATTLEQLQELLESVFPEPDAASPSDRLHSFDHIYPGAAGSTLKEGKAAR